MAILKCKMCGGDLNIVEGASTAECEYCGSIQTVPKADSEKKLTLFGRANRLRAACEFDKAAGVYEAIVAEFPEEAEAYWGLVLCKYGIEYVDDPASGKKIPTCHRSSFSSIMEDADFEQALENADVVARKVYREEAKAIEELRKGIVAVSANEKPYDIFICYKETDEKGERTLDSVLAQDVYDALTGKGYRVFFSRISLEDKLGTEYEPYIFAALNSAKLMLVFGTDYEYFNAIWVKNEWSRYLKLMAGDKEKHLIPCYKGIDAYDMPGEFARLQAQDMGKVGATQDLLRGIEKLLPREKEKTEVVVQERVLVSGGADNRVASQLKRGYMALEDSDFERADDFFEEVLNNDSENASAYLGKALAEEECRTPDELAQLWLGACRNAAYRNLVLQADKVHIEKMVERYTIPGHLQADSIRKLYDFDLSYSSQLEERTAQSRAIEEKWKAHKWLSKAERFATGADAEVLKKLHDALFEGLSELIRKAKDEEANAREALLKRYQAHLKQADAQAEKMHNETLAQLEECYQELVKATQDSNDESCLRLRSYGFDRLGDYKDSAALAEQCRSRADEINGRQAYKKIKTRIILFALFFAIIAAVCVVNFVIIPSIRYSDAKALMDEERFDEALVAFEALDGYRDSAEMARVCRLEPQYRNAVALMDEARYEEAIAAFEALDGYKDSAEMITVCRLEPQYRNAVAMMEEARYEEAIAAFESLNGYKDSAEMLENCNVSLYDAAVALMEDGNKAGAAIAFGKAGDYQDARTRSMELWDEIAQRESVSAGNLHAVGLRADGTVVAVGRNFDHQCNVSGWRGVVAVSAGYVHTVGLRADGTVLAVGRKDEGLCDVSGWRDVVAVSAGGYHSVGLKSDGTVLAVGNNEFGQCDVSEWRDVVAVSAGEYHTVGLRADGTVIAVGKNDDGQCDVSGWSDIVAVSAGEYHTVGLRADGTVVAVGDNEYGQCDVSGWSDVVAVSAGAWHTVGLRADGTVVAAAYNHEGQRNVSGWRDIVDISAGRNHTVGLRADGTVVAAGYNFEGECDVSEWRDIKLPE